eukprot:2192392-Amphidinium_carterae.1
MSWLSMKTIEMLRGFNKQPLGFKQKEPWQRNVRKQEELLAERLRQVNSEVEAQRRSAKPFRIF